MHLIIVHRLLQNLLLPPLNAIIIILLGFLSPKIYKKTKVLLIFLGIIILYLQATPIFAYKLAKSIETEPILPNSQNLHPDAIVILSGGVNPNGYEYPIHAIVNTDTFTRLRYGVFLAHKYPEATLILSGGYTGSKYREADVMKDTLDDIFDIDNPVIVENNSLNTNENAKFTANIIRQHHFKKVILVTQAYHMKRALMLFNLNGVYPIAASTDYTHNDDATTLPLMLVPNSRAQNMTSRTLHEIFGYYLYKLNYFIEGGTKQFLDYL